MTSDRLQEVGAYVQIKFDKREAEERVCNGEERLLVPGGNWRL